MILVKCAFWLLIAIEAKISRAALHDNVVLPRFGISETAQAPQLEQAVARLF